MRPSLRLRDVNSTNYGTTFTGAGGQQPWVQMPKYDTYRSKYGPNYKISQNFHGITLKRAMNFGITAGGFGAVAGVFALFFFGDVPKVRNDILSKLPGIGEHFIKEIPPEDNPF